MTKTPSLFFAMTIFLLCSNPVALSRSQSHSNSTQSINELPFCAFILRSLESSRGYEVHVLTEPDQITDGNLMLLSKQFHAGILIHHSLKSLLALTSTNYARSWFT